MEVTGNNLLANLKRSTVNLKRVRKLVEHSADLALAGRNEELTTGFHTFRMTGYDNRNVDDHRFGVVHCEEIHVEALVLYRMPLKLVENGVDFLTVAELKVDDV